jgi:hypothetical protein
VAKSQIFGNFIKSINAKSAYAAFIPIAQISATFGSTLDKRWSKVRLFGHFVKSAQYKKHIGHLLRQLLKPKQLLTQPGLNGG